MSYGIFEVLGDGTGSDGRKMTELGRRFFPCADFPTVREARECWYDNDMGNANRMIVLPASTPENTWYRHGKGEVKA